MHVIDDEAAQDEKEIDALNTPSEQVLVGTDGKRIGCLLGMMHDHDESGDRAPQLERCNTFTTGCHFP